MKTIFVRNAGEPTKVVDLRKKATRDLGIASLAPMARLQNNESEAPPTRAVRFVIDVPEREDALKLMNSRRVMQRLAHDLHVPWCRYFVRRPSQLSRRFCLGNGYQYGHHDRVLKPSLHARFDIAGERSPDFDPKQDTLHEAEVLRLTDEACSEFRTDGSYKFILTSTYLLDYAFGECSIPDDLRATVYQCWRKATVSGRSNRVAVLKALRTALTQKLSLVQTDRLIALLNVQARAPKELELKIIKTQSGFKRNALWDFAIRHLETLYYQCEGLGVNPTQLQIDLTLMPDSNLLCHSGLVFLAVYEQLILSKVGMKKYMERQVLALGGRYDNALYHYTNPLYPQSLFGVGVELYCDSLSHTQAIARPKAEKAEKSDTLLVLEPIFGKSPAVDKDCLGLLQEMWRYVGPTTAELFERRKPDEWVKYCQAHDYRRLVVLKQPAANAKYSATIRSLDTNTNTKDDIELSTLSELSNYLSSTNAASLQVTEPPK